MSGESEQQGKPEKWGLKGIWQPILVVVIGLVVIGYGLSFDPTQPTCGAMPMTPGQICETTAKGVPRKESFEDLAAEARTRRLWIPVSGGALALAGLGWGAFMLKRSRRTKPAQPPTQPSAAPAPAAPGPAAAPAPATGHWVRRSPHPQAPHPQAPNPRAQTQWPQAPQQVPPPMPPQQPPTHWPAQPPQNWPPAPPHGAPVQPGPPGAYPPHPFSGPTPPRHHR